MKKLNVVVVENEKYNRKLLEDIMKTDRNVSVCISFSDGCEAWKYLEENGGNVDLVVSDVEDGLRLLTKIREKFPYMAVIIMSGTSRYGREAEERGAEFFLAKPFSLRDLRDRLEHISNLSSLKYRDTLEGRAPAPA